MTFQSNGTKINRTSNAPMCKIFDIGSADNTWPNERDFLISNLLTDFLWTNKQSVKRTDSSFFVSLALTESLTHSLTPNNHIYHSLSPQFSLYIWFILEFGETEPNRLFKSYVESIQMNQELRHNKAIYCATILLTDATELIHQYKFVWVIKYNCPHLRIYN